MPQFPLHESLYFDTREFIDERTWNILGIKSAWMIDPKIVAVCDLLRELTGLPVKVNNWHYYKPGQQKYVASGLRAKWERTGAELSQHRLGRAADVKIVGMSPTQIFNLIMVHSEAFAAVGLSTMEDLRDTKTWNHLDCRPKIKGIHPEIGFLIVRG